jgi:F-box interacting protein
MDAMNQKRKKTCRKRKRSTNTDTPPAEPIPELSDEIVLDILVRLPVKSLLRCKSVCKGWRAIITDPFFVRAHLKRSASRCEENPCVVITPHTIGHQFVPEGAWPTTFSNHIRFYQWQEGASMATLMHDKDFGSEFRCVRAFAQCDGLVLVPTDTGLYLFNPATRENLTLPDSNRDSNWRHSPMWSCCCCAGLGLDPRTGKHKVVRTFYRSVDPDTYMGRDMGMEVFTISANSKGAWREIRDDLPYPPENWRTAMAVNGFLFWRLGDQDPPWGLLRFSLANETFGITRLPDSMDLVEPDAFTLDVLQGELCVSARTSEGTVTMWMLSIQEEGGQGQPWEQRYTIHLTSIYRPMAFLPGGRIMLNLGNKICLYDMATAKMTTVCEMDRVKYQGRRARSWKNIFAFNVHLYTESLVQISV